MPYGIPKSSGGDNSANVRKMERCIKRVMKRGRTKTEAIRICKSTLFRTRRRKRRRCVKRKHK